MKTLAIFGLLLTCGLLCEVTQPQSTRIIRLEVDGKQVKKSYRVFFLSKGTWTEAQKTAAGFTLPRAIENEEYLTLIIAFGKHRLKFDKVHISNFRNDWIVGVDTEPFSEEFVKPDEQRAIEQIYYMQFEEEPGRQLIVTKLKKQPLLEATSIQLTSASRRHERFMPTACYLSARLNSQALRRPSLLRNASSAADRRDYTTLRSALNH